MAQFFPPQNAVASQRALRLARALLDRYRRLTVVCQDPDALDPAFLDHAFGRDVLDDPRLTRLVSRPVLERYGYGARGGSFFQSAIGAVATRLFCGFGVDWIPAVVGSLNLVPATDRVRVVVATGPPFLPFGAVARWAASRHAPVILDYRDLWTANPHAEWLAPARILTGRLFERPANARATALSTVSEGCRVMLEAASPGVPVHVLYNAPDRQYLTYFARVAAGVEAPAATAAPVRVVFAGQVYRGCTFAPLLRAWATLPAATADRLELHYYGASSALARREFAEFGLDRCLRDHGTVTKEESLRAILGADVLLSLIHADRIARNPAVAGHMSTKVYDYFLSGRPILNIGPENGETSAFAARVGYAPYYPFVADDTAGLSRFLTDAVGGAGLRAVPALSVALPEFEVGLHAILDSVDCR